MLFLILALVLLVVGVSIYALIQKKNGINPTEVAVDPDVECCGAHDVCETDSLLNSNANVVYYDDEELDRFARRDPKSYDNSEIDEFQDVLITMKEIEVAAWLKSLMLRQIELPSVVKEEALIIVDEVRQMRRTTAS